MSIIQYGSVKIPPPLATPFLRGLEAPLFKGGSLGQNITNRTVLEYSILLGSQPNLKIFLTFIAGIKDFIQAWWQLFPDGKIAIKGGDRTLLLNYIQALYPEITARLIVEPNLIFLGIREILMKKL